MKVHEIMTGHPRSVAPDTTLVEAAGLMRELDVGALPVCDGDELAGIVTDRDLVVRGLADGRDPEIARVSEVMSGGVEAVSGDDEVENAVRIMEQRQIRRLPVLGRDKRLIGMISLGDVATSSNPAFGGIALRDVSEPGGLNARRRRLEQQSAVLRMPMGGKHAPSGRTRNASTRAARAPSDGNDGTSEARDARRTRQHPRSSVTKRSGANSPRGGRARGSGAAKSTRRREKSRARGR